jgi:hypothetical protein
MGLQKNIMQALQETKMDLIITVYGNSTHTNFTNLDIL